MEEKKTSQERKSLVLKTIILVVLLMMSILATFLYVFAYPKTKIILYDSDGITEYETFSFRRYANLGEIAGREKPGHTFIKWLYENGEEYDPDSELTTDVLKLYASYEINQYTITYHVKVKDPMTGEYVLREDIYAPEVYDYETEIVLPDGNDKITGERIPEFDQVFGNEFVGWTLTEAVSEDDLEEGELRLPGESIFMPAGNLHVYAHFQKLRYDVVVHSGVKYHFDQGAVVPKRDVNNEYIITNDKDRLTTQIRYLDYMTIVADANNDIKVTVDEVAIGNEEYVFEGWYLEQPSEDNGYVHKYKVTDYLMEVLTGNAQMGPYYDVNAPYLQFEHTNPETQEKEIIKWASTKNADGKYQFHLYSKWVRKSYTLSFNTNSTNTTWKVPDVKVYKYDELYGKYYNTGISDTFDGVADFSRNDMKKSGVYYNYINLNDSDITSEDFKKKAVPGKQFYGWTTTKNSSHDDAVWYIEWFQNQDKSVYGEGDEVTIRNGSEYYKHEVSSDVTLYAQWSTIRQIKFKYSKNSTHSTDIFVFEGIDNQWFWLEDPEITRNWSKAYHHFAGWKTSEEKTKPDYAKSEDESFSYKILGSKDLYPHWEKIDYTIDFYMNDGSNDLYSSYTAEHGNNKKFPGIPVRDGYVFEGWSRYDYDDNKYAETCRDIKPTSADTKVYSGTASYTFKGDWAVNEKVAFYAIWTKAYKVEYLVKHGEEGSNANNVTGSKDYVHKYSAGGTLKLSVDAQKIADSDNVENIGHKFVGWQLKSGADSKLLSQVFKAGNSISFDFLTNKLSYTIGATSHNYDIKYEGANSDTIYLYAKWEPETYFIYFRNTLNNNSTKKVEATYNEDLDLTKINEEHAKVGYVLKGWALTSSSKDIAYTNKIPGADIVSTMYLYTVYDQVQININYVILDKDDGTRYDYTPAKGSTTSIGYGGQVILPTPSDKDKADYGYVEYEFGYWYYEFDGNEYKVVSGETLTPSGDVLSSIKDPDDDKIYNLTLCAKFNPLTYSIKFEFVSPYTSNDARYFNISFDVKDLIRDYKVTTEIYDEYIATFIDKLNDYDYYSSVSSLEDLQDVMKEYSFDGLYNYYAGNIGGKIKLTTPTNLNSTNYPVFTFLNEITFEASWIAHDVTFRFNYDTNVYTGATFKYNYTSGIKLPSNTSDVLEDLNLPNNERLTGWILFEGVGGRFDLGQTFLEYNTTLTNFDRYITWVKSGNKYIGYLDFEAETKLIFTINYYVFDGTKNGWVSVFDETVDYSEGDNNYTLNGSAVIEASAKYPAFTFKHWRVGSPSSSTTKDGSASIKLTDYPYEINFYAIMEVNIRFQYPDINTDTTQYTIKGLKKYTLDYVDSTGTEFYGRNLGDLPQSMLDDINTTVESIVPTGYTVYGYIYGTNNVPVYSSLNGMLITANPITVYLARNITVTYRVENQDAKWVDNTTADKVFTSDGNAGVDYMVGFDGKILVTITIEDLEAVSTKDLTFNGWTLNGNQAQLYKGGAEIKNLAITRDITMYPSFKESQPGDIGVIIKLINGHNGAEKIIENQYTNGGIYTLPNEYAIGWQITNMKLINWTYEGLSYDVGYAFEIPLNIAVPSGTTPVFVFTANFKEVYEIEFDKKQANATMTGATKITVIDGDIYSFTSAHEPYIPVVGEEKAPATFMYWLYIHTDEYGNETEFRIYSNDKILVSSSTSAYSEDCNGYYTHYIPKGNSNTKTFVAVWEATQLTITVNVTNPDPEYATEILSTTNTIKVYYGDVYTVREFIEKFSSDSAIAELISNESNTRAVKGFANSLGGAIVENILENITTELVLYTVWENKYALSYDTSILIRYNNGTPATSYHFAGESITIEKDLIKSISHNNYITVYFDNGSYIVYNETKNNARKVSGFSLTNGNTFNIVDGVCTFAMPSQDTTVTPQFTSIYKVDFRLNDGTETNAFVHYYENNIINLSKYTCERTGYEFKGWNTKSDATTPLSNTMYTISSGYNAVFYAIWESNATISIRVYNSNYTDPTFAENIKIDVFKKIDGVSLEEQISKKRTTLVAGNSNTYKYNNIDYYLVSYYFNGYFYNATEIMSVNFELNDTLFVVLREIYIVNYDTSKITDKDGNAVSLNPVYLAKNSHNTSAPYNAIISGGLATTFTLAGDTTWKSEDEFATPSKWIIKNREISYDFGTQMTETYMAILASYADTSRNIALQVGDTYNHYDVKVYGFENTSGLYNLYDTSADANTVLGGLSNITANVRDENGQPFSDGSYGETIKITYGTYFTIVINDDYYSMEGYTLIGWSTTLDKLGYVENSIAYLTYDRVNGLYISSPIYLGDGILNDGQVVLYPVYEIDIKLINIDTDIYGKVNYTITTSASEGYVENIAQETGAVAPNTLTGLTLNSRASIVLTAESTDNKYEFDKFVIGGEDNTNSQISFAYADVNNNITIYSYFKIKTNDIRITLSYSSELKELDTTTNIEFTSTSSDTSITLDTDNRTKYLNITVAEFLAITKFDINELFSATVKTGNRTLRGEVGASYGVNNLNTVDGYLDICIILTPGSKYYDINISVGGGEVPSDAEIIITNDIYVVNNIRFADIVNNKINVPKYSNVTINFQPTKEGCLFDTWTLDREHVGDTVSITNINSNHNIDCIFASNEYSITYIVDSYTTSSPFIGGRNIEVAKNLDFSAYIPSGYEITGWLEGENIYSTGDIISNTESRNYIFVANLQGKTVTVNYLNQDDDVILSESIIFGNDLTLIEETNSNLNPYKQSNKTLVWLFDGEYYECGEIISASDIDYAEEINIKIAYFNIYTINFTFDLTDQGLIEWSNKSSFETDLSYSLYSNKIDGTLDNTSIIINCPTPLNTSGLYICNGFSVAFDGVALENKTVSVGGTWDISEQFDPSTLVYNYTLKPIWVESETAIKFEFIVTGPTVEVDNPYLITEGDKLFTYSFPVALTGPITMKNLLEMRVDGNIANWYLDGVSIEKQTTYNEEYKLIGYKLYLYNIYSEDIEESYDKVMTLQFSEGASWGVAGYSKYVLVPIWGDRSQVFIHNASGDILTSFYTDQGALELNAYSGLAYEVNSGFKLLGLAEHNNEITNSNKDDYYSFDKSITVSADEIHLYPAITKIYTVQINLNVTTLKDKVDNSYTAHANTTTKELWIGNETVKYGDLAWNIYYGDTESKRGYTFAGFSTVGGKLFSDIVDSDQIKSANDIYTLNTFGVSGSTITIYLVWARDTVSVTLKVEADYKDRTEFTGISDVTIDDVYYNDIIEITIDDYGDKECNYVEYLNFVNSIENNTLLNTYWKNMTCTYTGTRITENTTIKFEFDPNYTLKYYASEDYNKESDDPLYSSEINIGDTITAESLSQITLNDPTKVVKFWTVEGRASDFFRTGTEKTLSALDLDLANNYYEIILVPYVESKEYKITIKYIYDVDQINNYLAGQSIADDYWRSYSYSSISAGASIFDKIENGGIYYIGGNSYSFNEYLSKVRELSNGQGSYNVVSALGSTDYYDLRPGYANSYLAGMFGEYENIEEIVYLVYTYKTYSLNLLAVEEVGDAPYYNHVDAKFPVAVDGNNLDLASSYELILNRSNQITLQNPEDVAYNFDYYAIQNQDGSYRLISSLSNGTYNITSFEGGEIKVTGSIRIEDGVVSIVSGYGNIFAIFSGNYLDVKYEIYVDDKKVLNNSALTGLTLTLSRDSEVLYTGNAHTMTKTIQFGAEIRFELTGLNNAPQFDNGTKNITTTRKDSSDVLHDFGTVSALGYKSIYIPSGSGVSSTDKELIFKLYLESKSVNIYFMTNVQVGTNTKTAYFTNGNLTYSYAGNSNVSIVESTSAVENSVTYNYTTKLKYGASVDLNLLVNRPVLNNCTFVKWIDKDGNDISNISNISSDMYVRLVMTPNDITIKYNYSGTTYYTETVTYGQSTNLPYIVIEKGNVVSYAWDKGNWGSTITLEDNSIYENNTLNVEASVTEKYTLVFDIDPALISTYPEQKTLTINNIVIPNGTQYYRVNSPIEVGTTPTITSDGSLIYGNTYYIPNTTIMLGEKTLTAWKVNGKTIFLDSDYYINTSDANADKEILFTPVSVKYLDVQLYITDYLNPTQTLGVSNSSMSNSNETFIPIRLEVSDDGDVSQINSAIDMITGSDTQKLEINGNSLKYFVWNKTYADIKNYTFYGWTTSNTRVFTNIKDAYKVEYRNNYALKYMFDGSSIRQSNSIFVDEISALINAGKSGSIVKLYAVWEVKPTITFDAVTSTTGYPINDSFTEEYQIGMGEVINLKDYPDQTKVAKLDMYGHTLSGWTDGNNYSLNSDVVITGPKTLKTVWSQGATITLDIGSSFNAWREYFARVTSKDINKIGYPQYVVKEGVLPDINIVEYEKIGDYITKYISTDKFALNAEVSLSDFIDENFEQTATMYDGYGEKYFVLTGWYDAVTMKTYSSEDVLKFTSAILSDGNVTLTAMWEPITLDVKFYYDEVSANSSDDTRIYSYYGSPIVLTVPFGFRVTTDSARTDIFNGTFEKDGDTYKQMSIYMYGSKTSNEYRDILETPYNYNSTATVTNDYWRFTGWKLGADKFLTNVSATNPNSLSMPIIVNNAVWASFERLYEVKLFESHGEKPLLSITSTNPFIAIGDTLDLAHLMISNLGTVNIVKGLYVNTEATLSYVEEEITDTLALPLNAIHITGGAESGLFVNVYVDLTITLKAYRQDTSDIASATDYKTLSAYLTNINNPEDSLFGNMSSNADKNNIAGYATYPPTFVGWDILGAYDADYFGSDDYFSIKSTVSSFTTHIAKDTDGKIKFYITITPKDGGEYTIKLETKDLTGLEIYFYARFTVTTTVALGELSDSNISSYTSISVNSDSKYAVVEKQNKFVKYTVVFGSIYTPEITFNHNEGYTISSTKLYKGDYGSSTVVSNYVDNIPTTPNDTKSNNGVDDPIADDYYAYKFNKVNTLNGMDYINVNRTTNNKKFSHEFLLSSAEGNGLVLVIDIDPIVYDLEFEWNPDEFVLAIYTKENGGSSYILLNADTTAEITIYSSSSIYQGKMVSTAFTIIYNVKSFSDDKAVLTFKNVPYGRQVFIKMSAIGKGLYKYSFDKWLADGVYGVSQLNMSGGYTITITPEDTYTMNTGTESEPVIEEFLDGHYRFTTITKDNKLNSITLNLAVPTDVASPWKELVKKYPSMNGYHLIQFNTTIAFETYSYKAGDDISSYLNAVNRAYISEYNTAKGVTDLENALNYFYFTGEWKTWDSWERYDANTTNYILDEDNDGLYNFGNNLYYKDNASVMLFTILEQAMFVEVDHASLDYLDNSKLEGVDRVALGGFSYTPVVDIVPTPSQTSFTTTVTAETDTYDEDTKTELRELANKNIFVITNDTDLIQLKVRYSYDVKFEFMATALGGDTTRNSWHIYGSGLNGETNETTNHLLTLDNEKKNQMTGTSKSELNFTIYAMIDTNTLTFENKEEDGTFEELMSMTIAYDEEVLVKGKIHYGYTLEYLYNNNLIPLFDLQKSDVSVDIRFRHYLDTQTNIYGKYQYLFESWVLEGTAYGINTILIGDTTLRAKYIYLQQIQYRVFDDSNGVKEGQDTSLQFSGYNYYLPISTFADCFNNEYSNSLDIAVEELSSISGLIKSAYVVVVGMHEPYVTVKDLSKTSVYHKVTNMEFIKNNNLPFVVYPIIQREITTQDQLHHLYTIGGAYSISYSYNNVREINLYNIIDIDNIESIVFIDALNNYYPNVKFTAELNEDGTFAIWYWKQFETGIITQLTAFVGDGFIILEHYNPKFEVRNENKNSEDIFNITSSITIEGDLKNSSLSRPGDNVFALFGTEPTLTLLGGGAESSARYTYKNGDGTVLEEEIVNTHRFAYSEERSGDYVNTAYLKVYNVEDDLIYTFTFNAKDGELITKFGFNVYTNYNMSAPSYILGSDQLKNLYINDNWEYIIFDWFAERVGGGSLHADEDDVVNVDGDQEFVTFDIHQSVIPSSETFKLIQDNNYTWRLIGNTLGDVATINGKDDLTGLPSGNTITKDKFTHYLEAFEIQYNLNGVWTTMAIVGDYGTPITIPSSREIHIRFVATWKTITYTFAPLTYDNSATVEGVSGIEISRKYIDKDTSNLCDFYTGASALVANVYIAYYGDTVSYNVETETFTINKFVLGGSDNISIDVGEEPYFFHGWTSLNKAYFEDFTFEVGTSKIQKDEYDYSFGYTFYAFIDTLDSTTFQVDRSSQGSSYNYGYGNLSVTAYSLKSYSTTSLCVDIDRFVQNGSTKNFYYISSLDTNSQTKMTYIISGKGGYISSTATPSDVKHEFVNYNVGGDSVVANPTTMDIAGEMASNIHVLFNADPSYTLYRILDGVESNNNCVASETKGRFKNEWYLYGGYTINYSATLKDGDSIAKLSEIIITIIDHFGNKKMEFTFDCINDGVDDALDMYSSTGFVINDIKSYVIEDKNLNRYITDLSGYDGTLLGLSEDTSQTIRIAGDKAKAVIVDKFVEELYRHKINYIGMSVTLANGTIVEKDVLDPTYLYWENYEGEIINFSRIQLANNNTSMTYSISYTQNMACLDINESNGWFGHNGEDYVVPPSEGKYYLRVANGYRITSLKLYNYKNEEMPASGTLIYGCPYYFEFEISENAEIELNFKLTLPYVSDYNQLGISGYVDQYDENGNYITKYSADQLFNILNVETGYRADLSNMSEGDVVYVESSLTVFKGTTVTFEYLVSSQCRLTIRNRSGFKIGEINVTMHSEIFSQDNNSFTTKVDANNVYNLENVHLDQSSTYNEYVVGEISGESSVACSTGAYDYGLYDMVMGAGSSLYDQKYKVWTYDEDSPAVSTFSKASIDTKELNYNSTIILEFTRRTVEIIIDETSMENSNSYIKGTNDTGSEGEWSEYGLETEIYARNRTYQGDKTIVIYAPGGLTTINESPSIMYGNEMFEELGAISRFYNYSGYMYISIADHDLSSGYRNFTTVRSAYKGSFIGVDGNEYKTAPAISIRSSAIHTTPYLYGASSIALISTPSVETIDMKFTGISGSSKLSKGATLYLPFFHRLYENSSTINSSHYYYFKQSAPYAGAFEGAGINSSGYTNYYISSASYKPTDNKCYIDARVASYTLTFTRNDGSTFQFIIGTSYFNAPEIEYFTSETIVETYRLELSSFEYADFKSIEITPNWTFLELYQIKTNAVAGYKESTSSSEDYFQESIYYVLKGESYTYSLYLDVIENAVVGYDYSDNFVKQNVLTKRFIKSNETYLFYGVNLLKNSSSLYYRYLFNPTSYKYDNGYYCMNTDNNGTYGVNNKDYISGANTYTMTISNIQDNYAITPQLTKQNLKTVNLSLDQYDIKAGSYTFTTQQRLLSVQEITKTAPTQKVYNIIGGFDMSLFEPRLEKDVEKGFELGTPYFKYYDKKSFNLSTLTFIYRAQHHAHNNTTTETWGDCSVYSSLKYHRANKTTTSKCYFCSYSSKSQSVVNIDTDKTYIGFGEMEVHAVEYSCSRCKKSISWLEDGEYWDLDYEEHDVDNGTCSKCGQDVHIHQIYKYNDYGRVFLDFLKNNDPNYYNCYSGYQTDKEFWLDVYDNKNSSIFARYAKYVDDNMLKESDKSTNCYIVWVDEFCPWCEVGRVSHMSYLTTVHTPNDTRLHPATCKDNAYFTCYCGKGEKKEVENTNRALHHLVKEVVSNVNANRNLNEILGEGYERNYCYAGYSIYLLKCEGCGQYFKSYTKDYSDPNIGYIMLGSENEAQLFVSIELREHSFEYLEDYEEYDCRNCNYWYSKYGTASYDDDIYNEENTIDAIIAQFKIDFAIKSNLSTSIYGKISKDDSSQNIDGRITGGWGSNVKAEELAKMKSAYVTEGNSRYQWTANGLVKSGYTRNIAYYEKYTFENFINQIYSHSVEQGHDLAKIKISRVEQ